jgi:hypothetical protein
VSLQAKVVLIQSVLPGQKVEKGKEDVRLQNHSKKRRSERAARNTIKVRKYSRVRSLVTVSPKVGLLNLQMDPRPRKADLPCIQVLIKMMDRVQRMAWLLGTQSQKEANQNKFPKNPRRPKVTQRTEGSRIRGRSNQGGSLENAYCVSIDRLNLLC